MSCRLQREEKEIYTLCVLNSLLFTYILLLELSEEEENISC